MHLLPRPIPFSATGRQLRILELPPGTEISSLHGKRRHAKAAVHQWPTTVHSRSATVHIRQRIVHSPFACRRSVAPPSRRLARSGARSVLVENQRHFGAGSNAVADHLLVLGPNLMLLENRIAGLVNGKEVRVDGITLGVAHAFRPVQTNPHEVSSLGGPTPGRSRFRECARSQFTVRYPD